jgi:ribose 5-phosphate isomerase A
MQEHRQTSLPAGLAQPALRALSGAGITNLEQLAAFSEKEISRLHGIGPNALGKLRRALDEAGLSFADSPDRSLPGQS